MVALSHVLFGLTTASALVIPRDGATLLADLQAVSSDYNALEQADRQFAQDGDAVNVQTKVTKIDVDNDLTTADALLSGPISESDSQAIIDFINNTLEPSVKAEIAAAIDAKPKVASEGLASAVALEMTQLKLENDNIGNAIGAKVPADKLAALKAVIAKIDSDYDFGISQFS